MEIIKRQEIRKEHLPGRMIQKAVGRDAHSASQKISMGFARYSEESGPMEPHHHAEEVIYVLSSQNGYVRTGSHPDRLGEQVPLESGLTLHFPELEWHVFEFESGGHVDIIFIYGQVDNIRPEEIEKS